MVAAPTETELEEFAGHVMGMVGGMTLGIGIWLGDELGLYAAMADGEPRSADAIAAAAGCHPRLVLEWLNGQASAGLLVYEPVADAYAMSPAAIAVLADDESPAFVARAVQVMGGLARGIDEVTHAFRTDGALPWGAHDCCVFKGVEWFFRGGYRAFLPTMWLPSLDGVVERLERGATVADVGCGHGISTAVMAEAYPNSRFVGIDFHGPSIDIARERAVEAGVSDRVEFRVADAKGYDGEFDLICFFDCLHDMGDPVGAARHARSRLTDGGSVMLVEPFALDDQVENMTQNPMAPMFYTASSMVCVPNSLSQEVGLGLGGQAGEAKWRELFLEAGYDELHRATQTPANLVLQAR